VRYIEVIKGKPVIGIDYTPKMAWAKGETESHIESGYIKSTARGENYESMYLYSDLPLKKILRGQAITLEGNAFFLLSYNQKILPPGIEDVFLQLEKTKVYWLDWISHTTRHLYYNDMIQRSMLTLKMLTYEKTGAVLAALTTSLPETIGEERNWDYRFCWIRDAAMTVSVLEEMGANETLRHFVNYILSLISYKDKKIQIMYAIGGQEQLTEYILDHLDGYQGSKPVRIGNAAYTQKQNDIYGILLDALYKSLDLFTHRLDILENLWTIVRSLIRNVQENWHKPDKGIWEIRGQGEHFVFSKVLCWVAVDRGIKIAEFLNKNAYVQEWSDIRENIKNDIHQNGYNEEIGAFTQSYGSNHLDAANLLMGSYGFITGEDPRYIKTVQATKKELLHKGLMYRYKNQDDFGLPKSSFTVCSFWMVDSLIMIGKRDEAREMFDHILSHANHLGLLSEDIDFATGRLLGNFPQAYSHLALVSSAVKFDQDKDKLSTFQLLNELKD
jgi:GH15 family glucan-1,4-alpha-glucosidase